MRECGLREAVALAGQHILIADTPPRDGFLFLDRDRFAASFAADTAADQAAFMADSQVPWGVDALNGAAPQPAWRTEPTWHLVVTDDRMIPPPHSVPWPSRPEPGPSGPRQPLGPRLPARPGAVADPVRQAHTADRPAPRRRPLVAAPHRRARTNCGGARSPVTRGTGQGPATIGPPSAIRHPPSAPVLRTYLPQRITQTDPPTRAAGAPGSAAPAARSNVDDAVDRGRVQGRTGRLG